MTGTALPLPKHPSAFSATVLATVGAVLRRETERQEATIRVCDPFAGVGRIHSLARPTIDTVGVELEPEWAACNDRTMQGDSRYLTSLFRDGSFDAIATSPTYGSRMADHHEAKDTSRRITYRHTLGRPLSEGNSGAMQWGAAYRALHEEVWASCWRILKPGGLFVVNVSNHVRKKEIVPVVEWHLATLLALPTLLVEIIPVATPRMRFGENHAARVEAEHVLITRKPS